MKGIINMSQIERNNNKNFFMGVLTLLLDFKINQYEKNFEDAEKAKISINTIFKLHTPLLKELSTVAFFDFTLLRATYNFSGENNNVENLQILLNAFKYYKVYRSFRKRYKIYSENIYLFKIVCKLSPTSKNSKNPLNTSFLFTSLLPVLQSTQMSYTFSASTTKI